MLKRYLTSLSFIIIAVFILASHMPVFAYSDDTTHPALTQETVEFYNRLLPEKELTPEQKKLIIEGSMLEDIPPRWINHFYDPVSNAGWTGDKTGNIDSSLVRLLSRIGLSSEKPLSSVEWVNNYLIQESYAPYGGNRTWRRALEYYAEGNEEEAYKTLGYILHLIEDATVPDHTRDDTHAHALEAATGDPGSPYELYAERWTQETIGQLNIVGKLLKDGARPPKLQKIEDYIIAPATYSNRYFFSRDTINDPKYEFPKIVREDNKFGYGIDDIGKEFPLALVRSTWDEMEGAFIMIFELSDNKESYHPILQSYFDRLAPKAVLYGAGAIELFQQQAKDALVNKEFPTRLVRIDPNIARKLSPRSFSFAGEIVRWGNTFDSLVGVVAETTQNAISGVRNLSRALVSFFWQSDDEETIVEVPTAQQNILTENSENTPSNPLVALPAVIPQEVRGEVAGASSTNKEEYFSRRVIDGDTIVLTNGETVRYIGIDAQELDDKDDRNKCLAEEAKNRNEELTLGVALTLTSGYEDKDVYGRLLRYVWADEILVNETLIREGYAHAFSFGFAHPYETQFMVSERAAQNEKKGMWGNLCVEAKDEGGQMIGENEEQETRTESIMPSVAENPPDLQGIVINEIKTDKGEFVEFYNKNESTISLSGVYFTYYSSSRTDWSNPWRIQRFPDDATIFARGYYLVALGEYSGQKDWQPYSSNQLGNSAGTVALWNGDPENITSQRVDAVGWGAVTLSEGTAAMAPASSESIIRYVNGADTDNNRNDFVQTGVPTPGARNYISSAGAANNSTAQSSSDGTILGASTTQETSTEDTSSSTDDVMEEELVWDGIPSNTNHVLISEIFFDADGSDIGKEFVEFYNPTENEIDLAGWKVTKNNDSFVTIGSKKEDATIIPPLGFFLIGFNNYSEEPIADMVRSVSLPNSSTTIALLNAEGMEIDAVFYGDSSVAGESVERKAWAGACASAQDENEFSGNGCDTNSITDFDIRTTPRPQNSESLPEPREAPTLTNISAQYHTSRPTISFTWEIAEDAVGNAEDIAYIIKEMDESGVVARELFRDSGEIDGTDIFLDEVGRMYRFVVRVEDGEGFGAEKTIEVNVPSFITNAYVYKDAYDKYRVDIFYPSREFIPDALSEGQLSRMWQAIVVYRNQLPNKENSWLAKGNDWGPASTSGVVSLAHALERTILFGLNESAIGNPTGILFGKAFLLPEEDGRISFVLASSTEELQLTGNDYFTVAYYDFDNSSDTRNPILGFVARDHAKFFFSEDTSFQLPPVPPSDVVFGFNQFELTLNISWASSTDADSPDSAIIYETQISNTGDFEEEGWTSHGTMRGARMNASHRVEYPNEYIVGVRAVDDAGNASEPVAQTWSFPEGFMPFRLSGALGGGSQEFVLAEGGTLDFLRVFTQNFQTNAKNKNTKTCKVFLYEFTDEEWIPLAESDNELAGPSCAGSPEFSFVSSALELAAGTRYRWNFSLRGVNPSTFATIQFWGTDANMAGGIFSASDFQNAAFTIEGASGRLFSNAEE